MARHTASPLSPRTSPTTLALVTLLLAPLAAADLPFLAISPRLQDGILHRPSYTCRRAPLKKDPINFHQTFPWTRAPTCATFQVPEREPSEPAPWLNEDEIVPEEIPTAPKTFCAWSNAAFNEGRGISLVVTEDDAATFIADTEGLRVGGLQGQVGQEKGNWEVKYTGEAKGRGTFLKQDAKPVAPGEKVVYQTPMLLVSKQFADLPESSDTRALLEAALDGLPTASLEKVRVLQKEKDGYTSADVKAYGMKIKWPWIEEPNTLLAIIPEIARINHDCRANAIWRFNDSNLAFTISALRTINPGEEITYSYGYESRMHRRRWLSIQANLHFDCACSLCGNTEEVLDASSERLSEIKALKQYLPKDDAHAYRRIRLLPHIIRHLKDERLHTQVPMYQEMLAHTYAGYGVEDEARKWAEEARREWEVVEGVGSWQAEACAELAADVKAHWSWKRLGDSVPEDAENA